jgi:autotransporter-associated beta strand protein
LQVGNGGTNGTLGSGVITNNGQLVFNRSDTNLVIPNVIRGTGALTNAGTGRVSLSGASAFSGQVTVLQGTVRVLNSGALGGTIAGGTIVSNGATLDITNNANIGRDAIIAGGAGVGGNGAIINSSGANTFVAANFNQLTLYTNIVIGGSGRLDFRATSATAQDASLSTAGAPYTLTKIGSNLLQMAGVQIDGGLGDIIVNGGGTLGFQWQMPSLGNPANNLVVSNGTSIAFFQMSNAVTKNLILSNNASVLVQAGTVNEFDGPVMLGGTNTFNATGGGIMLFANEISGPGSLVKTGTNTIILSLAQTNGGAEIYSGNTTISQGTLSLLDNASLSNSPAIIMANSTLSVTGRVDGTLTMGAARTQTLAGGGVINGALVVSAGSTINPGNNTSVAVLTVSNATTLGGNVIMNLLVGTGGVTNDEIVAPSFSMSGPLTVTNVGPDLLAGEHFQLFNQAVSGFSSVTLPANNGSPNKLYQWRNDLAANGSITLTNVIVTSPTTNASITRVFLSGTNFVLQGSNNNVPNTNFHYQVFSSTNIKVQLVNWVPIATNSFNSDGTFNFTNPVTPGKPQLFFDVKVVP